MKRQTNEEAIVDAQDGFGNTFTVFKRNIGSEVIEEDWLPVQVLKYEYICIETEPESDHHTTICIYDNYKEFAEGTTWSTWIMQGIKDKELLTSIK